MSTEWVQRIKWDHTSSEDVALNNGLLKNHPHTATMDLLFLMIMPGVVVADCPANVFCICLSRNKYQKYKLVELGDQLVQKRIKLQNSTFDKVGGFP